MAIKADPWAVAQTLVLVATAGGIFLTLGKRDQVISNNTAQLKELRQISIELVRTQVLSEANDTQHLGQLNDLKRRVERLERDGD